MKRMSKRGKAQAKEKRNLREPRIFCRPDLPEVLSGATVVVDSSFIIDLSNIAQEIFLREELITIDNDAEMNNIGVYSVDFDNLMEIVGHIN